ncbi:MAG: MATE family efflux transporter [Gammaproteobacteria bacterium]|nr:MATE family efflux transporter [Gammaproteobacteria bacterium]
MRIASPRTREILGLSLPIIGGMTSQNVLNLVDTWLVGGLGAAALAATGISNFLNFMAVAAITGLSAAVQATAARRVGEGRDGETAVALNGGLLLSLAIGLPLTVVLILGTPWVLNLLLDDPEVIRQAVPYLQWRLVAVAFIGMNFSFRGYWSAVKLARLYLYTLLWMHALNIAFSWMLIYGKFGLPALGTMGAGIGTTLSIVIGTATYFWHAKRHAHGAGFLARRPSADQLRGLLRLGLPSCVQQLLFSSGFVVLFWIVGQIGTQELAVANVLVNLSLLAVLPGIGLGLSATTLVSQALGRKDAPDAHRWAWDVYRVGAWVFGTLALPMLLATDALLLFFLRDAQLVVLGRFPLQLVGLGILVDGLGLIMMHALLGAGAAGLVMRVASGLQWLLFLPLAYLLGPGLGLGLATVWGAMTIYRGIQAVVFIGAWERRGWAAIRI